MSDDKIHPIYTVADLVNEIFDAGSGSNDLHLKINDQLTEYVELIIVHKGCGKPLTGSSPKNGWCKCDYRTGMPQDVKQIMGWNIEDCEAYTAGYKAGSITQKHEPSVDVQVLESRCETAEKEVIKLTEKLERASKKIAELIKDEPNKR